jgi:thiamine pyrophosphokinase
MNAEKELLLALLIEKYTAKTQQIVRQEKVIRRSKHQRQNRGKNHIWTTAEKQHLIEKRAEGHSFQVIAYMMELRVSQCENMHYKLTQRDKAAI